MFYRHSYIQYIYTFLCNFVSTEIRIKIKLRQGIMVRQRNATKRKINKRKRNMSQRNKTTMITSYAFKKIFIRHISTRYFENMYIYTFKINIIIIIVNKKKF